MDAYTAKGDSHASTFPHYSPLPYFINLSEIFICATSLARAFLYLDLVINARSFYPPRIYYFLSSVLSPFSRIGRL